MKISLQKWRVADGVYGFSGGNPPDITPPSLVAADKGSLLSLQSKYKQAAQLHSEGIQKGFLSSLGNRFLALLYEAIDRDQNSILILSMRDGVAVGFVSGTLDVSGVYRILKKQPHRLFIALAPSLLKLSTWRKLFETKNQTSKKEESSAVSCFGHAELLSIAVDHRYRGTGVAADLYCDLLSWFRERSVYGFRIVVGQDAPEGPPIMKPAHCFYKKMGAVPVETLQVHGDHESVVYYHSINGT